jgi:hypothetical protein
VTQPRLIFAQNDDAVVALRSQSAKTWLSLRLFGPEAALEGLRGRLGIGRILPYLFGVSYHGGGFGWNY